MGLLYKFYPPRQENSSRGRPDLPIGVSHPDRLPRPPPADHPRIFHPGGIAAYRAEDQATRDAWDDTIKGKGSAMTGFNYYLGLYVKYLIDNAGTPPTPPFMPPSGS